MQIEIQKSWRLPTGNDLCALPSVSAASAAVPTLNFLSRKFRGLVEMAGDAKSPFLEPLVKVAGKVVQPGKDKSFKASRIESWVPSFQWGDPRTLEISLKVVAPPYERGFYLEYTVRNPGKKKAVLFLGAKGCWASTWLRAEETHELKLDRQAVQAERGGLRHLALSAGATGPEFGLAIAGSGTLEVMASSVTGEVPAGVRWQPGKALQAGSRPLRWLAGSPVEVAAGETASFGLLFGLGRDSASAAAACAEMRRHGLEKLWNRTVRFLSSRQRRTDDPELDQVLNHNLMFNYFYASGLTLDSEEMVSVISRSPHHPGAGTYSDRAAMMWSFPSVLLQDSRRARLLLENAFLSQGRNLGAQSRYLDGTLFKPGFGLDQLAAPVIALASYTRNSGDHSLANDFQVRKVLKQAEKTLQQKKHPVLALYESGFSPSDSAESLAYQTYGNVLVWRMFTDMAELKDKAGREQEGKGLREQAEKVRAAIWQNLTAEGPRGKMFLWASDLKGQKSFGTDPAGCLQLLPYWGFCPEVDQCFKNTVAWLHSREYQASFAGAAFEEIGAAAGPNPSVLAVANSLLSGRRDLSRELLKRLPMDGRLACESFSPKDGSPMGGDAFAAGAGFLSWALWKAFGKVR